MQVYKTLPAVDRLFDDNQSSKPYLLQYQDFIDKKIKQAVENKNTGGTSLFIA